MLNAAAENISETPLDPKIVRVIRNSDAAELAAVSGGDEIAYVIDWEKGLMAQKERLERERGYDV
jgi:hypothetical protein